MILVVGVNGTGKTTTIGKLAQKLREHDRKVLVGAGDTFRAAAEEQLEIWADASRGRLRRRRPRRAIRQPSPTTPSRRVAPAGSDVVIVDTAGRLHTQTNLMEELAKIRRVIESAHRRCTARDAARRRRDDRPERLAAGAAVR